MYCSRANGLLAYVWKSQGGGSSTGAQSCTRGEFSTPMTGIRTFSLMEMPQHIASASIKCATSVEENSGGV